MCHNTAKTMTLHSTRGELKHVDVPSRVSSAAKWLRLHANNFYILIAGYRNVMKIDELEMSLLEEYARRTNTNFQRVKPFLLRFMSVEAIDKI